MTKKYIFLALVSSFTFSFLIAEDSQFPRDFFIDDASSNLLRDRAKIVGFLDSLASSEIEPAATSFDDGKLISENTLVAILNDLQSKILETEDLDLIHLFQRAVRNFNSLSNEKAKPVTIYYKHYQAPAFLIPSIHLIIDVAKSHVTVTSKLIVKRNSSASRLILDGKDQLVQSVQVNGKTLRRDSYSVTKHELILSHLPDSELFEVEIQSQIDPFHNESLEGMYLCQDWLTTQCESEGARRIFFTSDRPDVLSRITTTIIADKAEYPYRLSNGNLLSESTEEDGRSLITWEDPFPKPSYLFACVMGKFSMLNSHYKTRSGLDVDLQVYVEPGKESRAEYSLSALKKAMEFDEIFFDREYDLSCLKMVAIPDFNSGAMENKGLMIFNDTLLLVDSKSGTDGAFRSVAKVIGHEYFHNWSGNRVTIRNWFEIALKEAFTDWRANLFGEWLFGEEFLRPKDVSALKEFQFPEEYSEQGHPIMVESYVDAHSIYDNTTYVKGREVFRSFEIYVNSLIPNGFRKVLNLYFYENDGKAVTFKELLKAADVVLAEVGKDSSQFERWFHQPGTPLVEVKMTYQADRQDVEFQVKQSCKHPKTGEQQKPYIIPFSIELIGNGGILLPKQDYILEEEEMTFRFPVKEKPTPIFMHGLSAPVNLEYDYTLEDLKRIMRYTQDAYSRWEAGQKYACRMIEKNFQFIKEVKQGSNIDLRPIKKMCQEDFQVYDEILKDHALSPISKVQLIQIPSVCALSQALNEFDYILLKKAQSLFKNQVAFMNQVELERNFNESQSCEPYEPISKQMQMRELRNICLSFLAAVDAKYHQELEKQYFESTNFNDRLIAFIECLERKNSYEKISEDFYQGWKEDKAVFNYWLSAHASRSKCTPEDLLRIESLQGYDKKNPNHIRSLVRSFIMNLSCYHDPKGLGYRYVVDKILEVGLFNPSLAHNYLAEKAFQDFDRLPEAQKHLMAIELKRLKAGNCSPQTQDLVERILKKYSEN